MKKLIPYCFLFYISMLCSQSKIDSLVTVFENAKIDTVKINTLHHLFREYQYKNIEKAKETALQSIQLSEKTNYYKMHAKSYNQYAEYLRSQSSYDSAIIIYNKSIKLAEKAVFNDGISEAYIGLGDIYLRKGDFKKSIEYQEKNIEFSKNINDEDAVASSYNNMGNVHNELGNYTKAMEYYTLSSKQYKAIGNSKNYAITNANIGMVLRRLDQYANAAGYFKKSDSVFAQIDFLPGRAFVLNNLAIIYENTGEISSAIDYNKKALSIYEKMGNNDQMGEVYYSMGLLYWKQSRFEDALHNFNKKLEIAKKVNDSADMSITYKAIGDSYFELKQNKNAKTNYLKALNIALTIDYELATMDAYGALSEVYEVDGNYKKAFESDRNYRRLKDSLYTKEKRELATEIEAKYQNEQKVQEIELLAKDNDLQALKLTQRINERNVIIAFACIFLLLGFLIYNQYRIKQKAHVKLQELDKLKSNFFTNISHEFRTPLTLIKGPIEQLEQNPDEPLSRENVKMIRRNANRLLKLVNQLLDLSKIDEGSLKLEPTEGDVYKCLRAATSSFNSYAAQHYIDYKVNIPQTSLWASFDREKLETIIYNLLSNAFKFSEDGSTVNCDVVFNAQGLTLQVADSGKGIPDDKIVHIFDRFYQVDSSHTKDKEGSGVGLSLTKNLVELMDGTITVSSEINKGSFFSVQLPLLKIKTGIVNTREEVPKIEEPSLQFNSFSHTKPDTRQVPEILVVEDNEDMRHFIKEALFSEYRITEAINGELGLKQAIKHPPDLIISDVMMPKMDGFELCEQLKTNIITSHIPVIILTAKAGMKNKIEGLETGADDYLTKPFAVKELLVRTKNLIEQRKNLRQLFSSSKTRIDPKQIAVNSIDQKFIEQMIALLEENYSESEFGIGQMQEQLAMSKTQLHRKLKALTNEAPGELLRNFRLKRAAQLLAQDADNVTQIAYQVGFNNLSYFAKCFKEVYGVTPSAYSTPLSK